jgi:hypothetical protein
VSSSSFSPSSSKSSSSSSSFGDGVVVVVKRFLLGNRALFLGLLIGLGLLNVLGLGVVDVVVLPLLLGFGLGVDLPKGGRLNFNRGF